MVKSDPFISLVSWTIIVEIVYTLRCLKVVNMFASPDTISRSSFIELSIWNPMEFHVEADFSAKASKVFP
jgi:hypothetical protein